MARQLPEDPKRRRQAIFRSIYQHMPHWREQILAGTMDEIMVIPETGEEVHYDDLLVGIGTLPPRQREAFELICLQGYTETAAAKIMLPNSRWSTTVQQHVNAALERMIARYDDQQSGVWQLIQQWRSLMALHPILDEHLRPALLAARKEIVAKIDEYKAALTQTDLVLKGDSTLAVVSPEPAPESESSGHEARPAANPGAQ